MNRCRRSLRSMRDKTDAPYRSGTARRRRRVFAQNPPRRTGTDESVPYASSIRAEVQLAPRLFLYASFFFGLEQTANTSNPMTATPPTAAGDYYATFAVAATEDWTGLSTNVAFTIEEYVQPFAVHIVRRRPRRSFPRSGRTTAPTTAPPPASMTAGRSRPKATSSPSSSSRPPSCGRGTASPPLPPPPPSRTRPPSPGATPRALAPPTEMSPDSSAPRGTSPSSPSVRRWARTTSPAPGATTRSSAPAPAWA